MSTIKVNTIQEATSGGATYFTNKAWVNFNGSGTVAISADGNVTDITDNGTGNYTINISNALTDANYAASGLAGNGSTDPYRDIGFYAVNQTTSGKIQTFYSTSTVGDSTLVMVNFTR